MGKHSSAARRKEAKMRLQKADADGKTRYKVVITRAFQTTHIIKAINEQEATALVAKGFGTEAGGRPPEVVDVAVLDMSMAETKGNITEEEGGKGLIEVVSG
jgi:hypothetical protein